MNKCYKFTSLLLAYLTAVIDCQASLTISKGDGNITQNKASLTMDLSQRFTDKDNITSFTNNTTYSSCSFIYVITENAGNNPKSVNIKINCPTKDVSSPMLCSVFKGDEKRYTLTEIILVAFGCFLVGVVLTALLFMLYMKRTQQGCFSKNVKEAQENSNQQSGPDLQFLTENVVVKKYDPKKPESADPKNENKSDDIQYQSLSSNRIDNDQQPYDKLHLREIRSDHRGNEPSFDCLKQTGNDEQTEQMTNLPHKTEGVYEYANDSDRGGHNYFILESENISPESKASNLGRPEIYAEVGDEVRDSTMETQGEPFDAAHEYFVLEHVENGHNQD